MKDMNLVRHSMAHILAAAIKNFYPNVKLGIGPSIDEGFYYDFDNLKISEADFQKIEEEMKNIIGMDIKFDKKIVEYKEAKELMKDEPYKLELIEELNKNNEEISFYYSGNFYDLCAGPHIQCSSELSDVAFKIDRIAGAYWRGDEKNKQLTRLYAITFPKKKELDEYLALLEEAKKRDHRKLGKEMELFAFSQNVGQGLPLWLPKGTALRERLENFLKKVQKKYGYLQVITPHIGDVNLYKTSTSSVL